MFTEEAPQRSFFDDDVPATKFMFQSPKNSHQKNLNLPSILRETFTIKSNQDHNARKCSFGLHNSLIVQFINDKNIIPDLVLDVLHARLELLKSIEAEPKYGFVISKNGTSYEFECQNKKSMDDWIEGLKRACVLSTFHEDYKAIKMIGRGSFAKVYLVESKATKKSYAVKAFTKDCMAVTNKACAKPSLLNEIEIMRAVNHENIIRLYEIYETDKSIYLVLELIQGPSLYDFLKKPNFKKEVSLTQIQNIVRSLLDALAYLASKGIMHRDLKPDNILLEKGEKVKLVDFGLATFIDVPSYIFKKCGTPGYIAPEVFKYNEKCPNTDYDDHCDVFSVGCLLHYMLFNFPFFQGGSASDILKLNKNYTPEYSGLDKVKHEMDNPCGAINKEGLLLLLDLLEYDLKKRVSANQALTYNFLSHSLNGIQRVESSIELSTGISRHTQGEIKSPCSPLHPNSMNLSQPYSPLKPLKIDAGNKENSILMNHDRFVKEDSLYLDLGRPEINGRTDTVATGSTANSLLLANRGDSSNNISPTCLPSAFSKKDARNSSSKKTYTGKSHNQGASQSFLKAAIFNNMQKNNSEGVRDDEGPKSAIEELRMSKNTSDFAKYGSSDKSEEEEQDEVSDEDAGIHHHIEKINRKNSGMHPSKISHSKMGRFQPTLVGTQLAQKNETISD